MSSLGIALEELFEVLDNHAKRAVKADRASEERFWSKLVELMSKNDQNFEKTTPIFIQLIATHGNFRRVPPKLIRDINHLARGLNETKKQLKTAREFPNDYPVKAWVLKRRFDNLKAEWDHKILLALQAAGLKVEQRIDPVTTMKKTLDSELGLSENDVTSI